jgi:SecD/SecF fusion protein
LTGWVREELPTSYQVTIFLGIGSLFISGFELGVDFKGGYSYNITFDQIGAISPMKFATLTTVFEASPIVKAVDTENTFNVSYLLSDQ